MSALRWRGFFLAAVLFSGLSTQAADPIEFSVGAFQFERPEGWQWVVPTSSMRKAELAVPNPDGEAAQVTFFHFGAGQGGGVQANVQRWFSQFQGTPEQIQAKLAESQVGQTKVTFVAAQGVFNSGMPGGPTTPMSDYALRGAILENANGDVFVKMTGPRALVEAAEPAFAAMIQTAAGRLK